MYKRLKKYFCVLIIILLSASSLLSQDSSVVRPHIFYPGRLEPWQLEASLGLTMANLPQSIVEEEVGQSPMIDFNLRFGLPYNFSINGRASSIVLTSHFSLGLQWSYTSGRFSFSLADDFAYWFGGLDFEGFDVSANGWMNYPSFSLGLEFNEFLLSIKSEALILTFHENFIGDSRIRDISSEFAGFAITFTVEQPFWNDNYILLGFKINNTKFFYQAWLSYETFDSPKTFPEFIVGFMF